MLNIKEILHTAIYLFFKFRFGPVWYPFSFINIESHLHLSIYWKYDTYYIKYTRLCHSVSPASILYKSTVGRHEERLLGEDILLDTCAQRRFKLACISVQSYSELSAWRNFATLAIQNVPKYDSDQAGNMQADLVFAGHTCPKVHFPMWIIWY